MALSTLTKKSVAPVYSVVQFTSEEETISAVPSTSVFSDKTKCLWPPGPSQSQIRRGIKPNPNWPSHPVVVLQENIVDYSQAKRVEKRLEDNCTTTDADTPTSSKFRTRAQRNELKLQRKSHPVTLAAVDRKDDSTSDDDSRDHSPNGSDNLSDNDGSENDEGSGILKTLQDFKETTILEGAADSATISEEPETVIQGIIVSSAEIEAIKQRQYRLEILITTAAAEIKDDLKEILGRVNQLASNNQIVVASKLPINFPITTKAGLDDVETWLGNESNVITLVNYCATLGGEDLGKIVRKILKTLLAPELALTINYIGANQKTSFQNLRLHRVVIDSTRSNVGHGYATEIAIADKIKNWFRNARDLKGGRKARKKNVVIQQQTTSNTQTSRGTSIIASTSSSTTQS